MQVSTFKVLAALWLWMAATLGGMLPFILKHKRKTPAAAVKADPSSPLLLHSPNAAEQALLSPNTYMISTKQSNYQPIRISTSTNVAKQQTASESNGGVTSPYGALSDHAAAEGEAESHVMPPSDSQPRVLKSPLNVDRLLSLGNMLSAGIFLGGGLLHLLAESNVAIQKAQKGWAGFLSSFPIAFFFCGFGFFMILTVEELTISFTARRERKKAEKERETHRSLKKNRKLSSGAESVIQIEQPKARRFSDPVSAFSRADGDQGQVLPPLSASLDSSRVPRQAQLLSMVAAVNIHEAEIPTSSSGSSSRSSAGSATMVEPVSSSGSSIDEPATAPVKPTHHHSSKDGNKKSDRDLARNLVHGLTPRLALVPDALRSRRQQEDSACSSCTEEEDEETEEIESGAAVAAGASNRGLKSKPAASDEKDVDEDDEDEEACGPIQSFLDAAYDSPSPFPSLADSSRMARHQQHQKKKSRKKPRVLRTKNTLINAVPSTSPPAAKQLTQPLLNGLEDEDDDLPPPLETGPSTIKPSSHHMQHDASCDASSHSHSNGLHAHDHHHHHHDHSDDSHEHFHKHLDADKGLHLHIHDADHGHGHGHGGEDGHSHFSIGNDTSYIVAYMLVLALSFHSIFEGLALGLQDDMPSSVSIFLAILAHSPLAGFALGVSLVKSHTSRKMALSCLFLFTIMTPLGTILGLLLSYVLEGEKLNIVSASFQSFSAGTFLFVALEEIIPKEMAQKKDTAYKLFLAVLGFLLMALIKCFDTDSD